MRPWKAILGVGAACAACCAVPLLGGVAALTVGTTALAAFGSALLACADEFVPLGIALLIFAALGVAVLVWRKRRGRSQPQLAATSRVELLGLYPTLETASAQAIIAFVALAGFTANWLSTRKRSP